MFVHLFVLVVVGKRKAVNLEATNLIPLFILEGLKETRKKTRRPSFPKC